MINFNETNPKSLSSISNFSFFDQHSIQRELTAKNPPEDDDAPTQVNEESGKPIHTRQASKETEIVEGKNHLLQRK